MMQIVSPVSKWQKKTYTAATDTTKGNATISAIQAELPNEYRYAVALKHDPTNVENNAFISCVFLPMRSEILGLRIRNGAYQFNANYKNDSFDLILRSGEKVDIIWRTDPIIDDVPSLPTGWNYRKIQPGTITRANALETAFANIAEWNCLVSVADIDFNTTPSVNRTYCESIVTNRSNFTGNGTFIRTNGDATQSVTNWSASYDCQVADTTLIANFYFM